MSGAAVGAAAEGLNNKKKTLAGQCLPACVLQHCKKIYLTSIKMVENMSAVIKTSRIIKIKSVFAFDELQNGLMVCIFPSQGYLNKHTHTMAPCVFFFYFLMQHYSPLARRLIHTDRLQPPQTFKDGE